MERLLKDLSAVRKQELADLRVETAPSLSGFGKYVVSGLTNKRTTMIGKLLSLLSAPATYAYSHLERSPSYHSLQDMVIAPWNNLGVTSHELGHAIDFNEGYVAPERNFRGLVGNWGSRLKRDAYDLAYPFVPIIHEVRAWEAAKKALKESYKSDKTQLTDEDKKTLNRQLASAQDPALSTYATGTLGMYFPQTLGLGLPVALGTALVNPRKRQQQNELDEAANIKEE